MATKKAKERTQKALVRAGKEAAQVEAERAQLAGELAQALSEASDLRIRLADAIGRVETVEETSRERVRRLEGQHEYEGNQIVDLTAERDGLEKRCAELERDLLVKTHECDHAIEMSRRAQESLATAIKSEGEKLSEEKTKKLRRRVAELKAEVAQTTSRFHRACSLLAKYDRDVVKELFNEGRRSLREIQGA